MTPFSELSFICRAMLGLWTLLLCLAGVVGLVWGFALRRYRNAMLSIPLFAVSYLMWQVTVCFLYLTEQELTSALCKWLGYLPYMIWMLVLLLLTAGSVFVMYSNKQYSRTVITPLTVERCGDELTCGICYWRDNGHVVFSNDCMNTLSTRLTGKPLMDGIRLRNAISDNMMPVGDRIWQFSLRDIENDKEVFHELIATDVTELYAESQALQADNARLIKMNEELKTYGLKIDETVRRQEMLQARIDIHDEMNRLMLSTVAADLENDEEMNNLFALWERNALLLCMESNEHRKEDALKQLDELAQALGIQFLRENDLSGKLTQKQRELLIIAAQEAITNAVKHAQASRMQASFVEAQDHISCTFENDGNIPKGEIHFTGGLVNLVVLAEEQNAEVSAQADETFKLSLLFEKNG